MLQQHIPASLIAPPLMSHLSLSEFIRSDATFLAPKLCEAWALSSHPRCPAEVITLYWPLIGQEWSRDLDTSLSLALRLWLESVSVCCQSAMILYIYSLIRNASFIFSLNIKYITIQRPSFIEENTFRAFQQKIGKHRINSQLLDEKMKIRRCPIYLQQSPPSF